MGKIFDAIDDRLREFIARQHMFFVATAPLSKDGHVNLSPKGLDTFRVLDETTVAYVDFVGSGVETIAHLKENGRIVIMFCAVDGPPKILRLHGTGEVVEPHHEDYAELGKEFPELPGVRAIIRVRCRRISDSCGFGVPRFEYSGHRSQLTDWAIQKGTEGLEEYRQDNNRTSIDGLPGLD